MDKSNIKPRKYLFGLFFENDFTFPTEKGKFLNRIRKEFKEDDLVFINDKLLGDNILSKKNPEFKIALSASSLHYEENLPAKEFLDKCLQIVSLHSKIFNNIDITKIGFIIYFDIVDVDIDDYFLRNHFFNHLDKCDKFKQISFHSNYLNNYNDIDYNFNVKIAQNGNNAGGEIDVNLVNQKGLTLTRKNINPLYDFITKYFSNQFFENYFQDYGKQG